MKTMRTVVLALIACGMAVAAGAQEGHPLTGTWYGDYGTGNQKTDLTIVMKWDGAKVTGLVNPGPNAMPVTSAVLDIIPGKPGSGRGGLNGGGGGTPAVPPVFNVRIEFGDLVLEGTLHNPVAGNRTLVGTYTRGAEKGPFQIRRL